MSAPLLRIENLAVRYPLAAGPALEAVSLSMDPGEKLAVIGESGSGKSTLARAIAGLLPLGSERSGTVQWPGLGRAPGPGRDHGFVFQEPGASLDPVMRIGAQLAEALRATAGLRGKAAAAASEGLLSRVGLPTRASRAFAHQLSGGQKQRAAIALAVAGNPALLIADEPTSALDAIVQKQVIDLMTRLVQERRMGLMLVTHDLALAALVADRIAVLKDGRLVEIATTGALTRRPSHPYSASLLRAHRDLERGRA